MLYRMRDMRDVGFLSSARFIGENAPRLDFRASSRGLPAWPAARGRALVCTGGHPLSYKLKILTEFVMGTIDPKLIGILFF